MTASSKRGAEPGGGATSRLDHGGPTLAFVLGAGMGGDGAGVGAGVRERQTDARPRRTSCLFRGAGVTAACASRSCVTLGNVAVVWAGRLLGAAGALIALLALLAWSPSGDPYRRGAPACEHRLAGRPAPASVSARASSSRRGQSRNARGIRDSVTGALWLPLARSGGSSTIITLGQPCVCSGSRAPAAITTSSTRTRSFSNSSRCESGAAIGASSSSVHGQSLAEGGTSIQLAPSRSSAGRLLVRLSDVSACA